MAEMHKNRGVHKVCGRTHGLQKIIWENDET